MTHLNEWLRPIVHVKLSISHFLQKKVKFLNFLFRLLIIVASSFISSYISVMGFRKRRNMIITVIVEMIIYFFFL